MTSWSVESLTLVQTGLFQFSAADNQDDVQLDVEAVQELNWP